MIEGHRRVYTKNNKKESVLIQIEDCECQDASQKQNSLYLHENLLIKGLLPEVGKG